MRYILSIIGMAVSFYLIKYRERFGDTIGESSISQKVGGSANLIVIIGVFIFFWSIAELTGTTSVLFAPLLRLVSLGKPATPATPF